MVVVASRACSGTSPREPAVIPTIPSTAPGGIPAACSAARTSSSVTASTRTRPAERPGEDVRDAGPGQVLGPVYGLHDATVPGGGEQARRGDVPDVAGIDPGNRYVGIGGRREHAPGQPVGVEQEVREEEAASQVADVDTGVVEVFLDPGQPVDVPDAVAPLGSDAAHEHHPRHARVAHGPGDQCAEPVRVAHGVGGGVRRRVDQEQRPRIVEDPVDRGGVGEVPAPGVHTFADSGIQPCRVAGEHPGPLAGLQQQPDDAGTMRPVGVVTTIMPPTVARQVSSGSAVIRRRTTAP